MVTLGQNSSIFVLVISPNVLINSFCRSCSLAETLVTQLLARNTSVALSVAMMATKSLFTFLHTLSLNCRSGSRRRMAASVSSAQGGRAGSTTSLPVPGHQPKAKKQALSSVSVPAPTQKRRKSQAQEQVTQVPQSPDSLEDPEPQKYRGASLATSLCGVHRKGR